MASELKALAAHKGPFEFAVFGDNRSGDAIYKKTIGVVLSKRPMFIINTGDLIPNPGDGDEWKNFWGLSKPISVPYFLTIGNHDVDDEKSLKVWRDEVDLPGNEAYYSFTVGKNLFVILNSCDPEDDRRITGTQLAWLKGVLDPSKYDNQFVFLHHPLFLWKEADHYGESLDRYPEARDVLHNLFVEKKVTAVFVGHEHTYKRQGDRDGVQYFITGGAGAPRYGRDSFNNAMIIKVDGKIVSGKVFDRDDYLRDAFYIKGP
jgi:hypothetical protein